MKKSYKKPFTEVVKLKVGEMLQVTSPSQSIHDEDAVGEGLGKSDGYYGDLW